MPLLWLSLTFLLGILLSAWQALAWWVWAAAAGACLLLIWPEAWLRRRAAWLRGWYGFSRVPLALLAALFCLGGLRYAASRPVWTANDLASYNGRGDVKLVGWIASQPESASGQYRARVQVEQLAVVTAYGANPTLGPLQSVRGLILVYLPPGTAWTYGQRLSLTGKLEAPPDAPGFSYSEYLARQGIYSFMSFASVRPLSGNSGSWLLAQIYALRQRAYEFINQSLPQPDASLLAGILLGLDQDMPASLSDAFRSTGTAHIIAISGFNIAILAGLFFGLFRRITPRFSAMFLTMLAIAAYTVMVGASASVLRAGIMGSIGLLGQQIGRRQAGLNSLSFTAAMMALLQPDVLWDVGFQLSFAATLGLVFFADPLQSGFQRLAEKRLPSGLAQSIAGPVGEYFLFTLAAQAMTLPVVLYHFQRLSFTAVIANPLVLPPQPALMVLGLAAVVAGLLVPGLGRVLMWLTWPFLAYTNRMVTLLSGIPGGALDFAQMGLLGVILFYAFMLLLVPELPRMVGVHLRQSPDVGASSGVWGFVRSQVTPATGLVALGLVASLTWSSLLAGPDGRLHVTLLDPEEPSLLVQTPGGASLLFNGAPDALELDSRLGQRLPAFSRHLDGLLVSGRGTPSLVGLEALFTHFPLDSVLWDAAMPSSQASKHLQSSLTGQGAALSTLSEGQVYRLEAGIQLTVLASDERGTVLLLEYGRLRLLLPAGFAPKKLAPRLAGRLTTGPLIVLGQAAMADPSTLPDWQAYNPALLLLPSETAPGTTTALDTRGGWLELTSDGEKLWVERGE